MKSETQPLSYFWRNPPLVWRATAVGLVWAMIGMFCGLFGDLLTSRAWPGAEIGAAVGMVAGIVIEIWPHRPWRAP